MHQYLADAVAHALLSLLRQGCSPEQLPRAILENKVLKQQRRGAPRLRAPFHPSEALERYRACQAPLALWSALDHPEGVFTPAAQRRAGTLGAPAPSRAMRTEAGGDAAGEGWRLFEDRAGRPGWIATQVGATIVFPVRFGQEPLLTVTYLRSYEKVGAVSLQLVSAAPRQNASRVRQLDAMWKTRHSLQQSAVWINRPDGVDGDLFGPHLWSHTDPWRGRERAYELRVTLTRGPKFKITGVSSC